MEDLKNCPFCDCEMEIVSVGRDWWRIKPVDGHDDTCPFGEFHEWDCSQQKPEWKDEHIADWNKRADDRLVEENAELREMLKKFIPSNDYYETNEDDEDVYCNHGGTFEYNEDSEHIGLEVVKLLNKSGLTVMLN